MPHSDTDSTAGVTAAALARVEAARARADAASVGPWIEDDGFVHGGEIKTGDRWARRELIATCGQERDESDADADFIAHARADVPLLAAIAAAAVRLVEDPYWWLASDEYEYRCNVCGGTGLLPVSVTHAPDCRAMALDAAIRAAGEAGHA